MQYDKRRFTIGLWSGIPALIEDPCGRIIACDGGRLAKQEGVGQCLPCYKNAQASGWARLDRYTNQQGVQSWTCFENLPACDLLPEERLAEPPAAMECDAFAIVLIVSEEKLAAFHQAIQLQERLRNGDGTIWRAIRTFEEAWPGLTEAARRVALLGIIRSQAVKLRMEGKMTDQQQTLFGLFEEAVLIASTIKTGSLAKARELAWDRIIKLTDGYSGAPPSAEILPASTARLIPPVTGHEEFSLYYGCQQTGRIEMFIRGQGFLARIERGTDPDWNKLDLVAKDIRFRSGEPDINVCRKRLCEQAIEACNLRLGDVLGEGEQEWAFWKAWWVRAENLLARQDCKREDVETK